MTSFESPYKCSSIENYATVPVQVKQGVKKESVFLMLSAGEHFMANTIFNPLDEYKVYATHYR